MQQTFTRLAEFVLGSSPDQIPQASRHYASLMLLDTLGITIGGGPMQAGKIARETAVTLYGSSIKNAQARLLFDGRKVSVAGAAYAAATQTDNLDGHDGYNPTKGHIGVAVVPALLALAETIADFSGPQALATIVIGYEIAGRAGISLHSSVHDYHTSGAWNALGVAAMAARMRGMTADQLRQALGIAEYHGPRSQMMREIANPTMLHDGSGWGAMVGISAAILAENGFTGAPAITVESQEAIPHWQDLGSFWQIQHQYVKPYPVCRWAHAAIDAVQSLIQTNKLNHDDIKSIHVNTFHESACLFQGIPDSTSKAQYSLSFAIATMVAYGRIGVEHISGEGLNDPLVARLIERISVAQADKHNNRFPAGRWADVQITLNDGRLLDSGDVHARGGPEAPMSDTELIAKFMEFSTPSLGKTRASQIRDAVLKLGDKKSSFSTLGGLLYEPADASA